MPVGFSSAPRNLWLLGASGQQVVTNFFKQIDASNTSVINATPAAIKYSESDEKYITAGYNNVNSGPKVGYLEKVQEDGSKDWNIGISKTGATGSGDGVYLNNLHIDSNDRLLVCGYINNEGPFLSRYDSNGVLQWQSTTNSGDVEYTSVTSDSTNKYYACGHTTTTPSIAFVERFGNAGVPSWGKSAHMLGRDVRLNNISANDRGEVVAVGSLEDDTRDKGYIVKIDTSTGQVMWDRTLDYRDPGPGNILTNKERADVTITRCYIEGNDNIYITGQIKSLKGRMFVAKYSPEGNLLWQKMTTNSIHVSDGFSEYPFGIYADTETEQISVAYSSGSAENSFIYTAKYSKGGKLLWRRRLDKGTNLFDDKLTSPVGNGLDGSPSFYFLLFQDASDPDDYTFGKVSTAGNGLGNFQYDDGTGAPLINYVYITGDDDVGLLSDGSIRNDTSDFIRYPISPNHIVFDDLATPLSNKKRQMDSADSFEYSGSPTNRPADFQELNLAGETIDVTEIVEGSGAGQAEYTTAGSYTWTAPAGVTSVCVVCVGGGGAGGGALAYRNNITVVPGTGYSVVVGAGGVATGPGQNTGTSGGDSSFSDGTNTTTAEGGVSGSETYSDPAGTYDGGGRGGYGEGGGGYTGGGAGGYSGDGGITGFGASTSTDGQGGGGGGGEWPYWGGGGVGIYGEGANGAAGTADNSTDGPGKGGSGGGAGAYGTNGGNAVTGGLYGGGYGSRWNGNQGGGGAVRIIWGSGRSFPSTLTADQAGGPGVPTEQTVTKAKDKSGRRRNGTIDGATLNADGYWEFDGTDDYINIPWNDKFDFGNGEWAIELWAYNGNGGDGSIMSWGDSLANRMDIGPRTGNSSFRFLWDFGGTGPADQYKIEGLSTPNNAWYHVVATRQNNTVRVYIDSVEKGSVAITGSQSFPIDTTNGIDIGRRRYADTVDNGDYFEGRIGEVRIYPRALSSAQIYQNYNATKSKYINEPYNIAPRITSGIVTDSNLILNYDFGNKACFELADNRFDNSTNYGSSNWNLQSTNGITLNTTDVLSPVGDYTATKWRPQTFTSQYIYDGVGSLGTDQYTMSVWVRAADGETADFRFNLYSPTQSSGINTATDQWNRFTWTFTAQSQTLAYPVVFEDLDKSLYIWGPQLEPGPTAKRYIPTYANAISSTNVVTNLSGSEVDKINTVGDLPSIDKWNEGGWVDFNGSSDFIQVSSNLTAGGSTSEYIAAGAVDSEYTLEVWVYVRSSAGGITSADAIIGHTSDHGVGIQVGISGSVPRFNFGARSTSNFHSTTFQYNTWQHVVLTRDGQEGAKGYRNAVVEGADATSSSSLEISSGETIGNFQLGYCGPRITGYFDGLIGEARVYNRALTAGEVSRNFNATKGKYGL